MTKWYIAYGSNMDERQMTHRCPEARVVGTGIVEGYRLLFKGGAGHAYATIEPEKDSRIPVLVWEICETDESRLDRYEGFPKLYYKKEIPVLVAEEWKEAMVYIMDERNPLNHPSCEYYLILEAAYLKFGFDNTVLNCAREESRLQNGMVSITSEKRKTEIDKLFEKIEGCRFYNFEEMENWFRRELKDDLPELSIGGCDGINAEVEDNQIHVDYSTDCTFGKNIFGFPYADFTIDYILDNEKRMYVTYARWS